MPLLLTVLLLLQASSRGIACAKQLGHHCCLFATTRAQSAELAFGCSYRLIPNTDWFQTTLVISYHKHANRVEHSYCYQWCVTSWLYCVCRQAAEEAQGQMQDDLSKLADDLVQKFEDQWKDTAENLDAASKAFDNLDGKPWTILLSVALQHWTAAAARLGGSVHCTTCLS